MTFSSALTLKHLVQSWFLVYDYSQNISQLILQSWLLSPHRSGRLWVSGRWMNPRLYILFSFSKENLLRSLCLLQRNKKWGRVSVSLSWQSEDSLFFLFLLTRPVRRHSFFIFLNESRRSGTLPPGRLCSGSWGPAVSGPSFGTSWQRRLFISVQGRVMVEQGVTR